MEFHNLPLPHPLIFSLTLHVQDAQPQKDEVERLIECQSKELCPPVL